jgi:predicted RNA-binding Zn ribbon-like protein
MHTDSFDLDAGALSLNFSNTVEWRNSDHINDKLANFADLITWAEAADILSAERADELRRLAENQPEEAAAAFARAIELRESIYRLFADFTGEGTFNSADLALINQAMGESLSHLKLVPSAEGFDWGWTGGADGFEQILWPVVRSAGELLISDQLPRVRECANERGCGYLFVDTSRNGSRRWCSMESCGNQAKARRHYKRHQKG